MPFFCFSCPAATEPNSPMCRAASAAVMMLVSRALFCSMGTSASTVPSPPTATSRSAKYGSLTPMRPYRSVAGTMRAVLLKQPRNVDARRPGVNGLCSRAGGLEDEAGATFHGAVGDGLHTDALGGALVPRRRLGAAGEELHRRRAPHERRLRRADEHRPVHPAHSGRDGHAAVERPGPPRRRAARADRLLR